MVLRYTLCLCLGVLDPCRRRVKQPSRRRPMPYNALRRAHTMVFLLTSTRWCYVRPWARRTWDPYPESSSPVQNCCQLGRKFKQLVNTTVLPFTLFLRNGKRNFCIPRWQKVPWRLMNLCVAWTMLVKLMTHPTTRNKRLPRFCSATKSQNGTLANPLLHVSPEPSEMLVDSSLHRFFYLTCVMRHERLAPGWPLVYCTFFAMVCVWHNDFILRVRNKDVELDVWMNPVLSHTTTTALSCTTFFASVWRHATILPRRGDLLHDLDTQVFYEAFNMDL